jgi:hypothetical protein
VTTTSLPQPGELRTPTRRTRARLIVGVCLAGVVFALMPLGVLGFVFALPLIGVILAWATPAEVATAQVRFTARTIIVLALALACWVVVALLPYETVFLLSTFGGEWGLLPVAVAGVAAVALPLGLRESQLSDGEVAPRRLWVTRRNAALAFTGLISITLMHNTGNTHLALLGLAIAFPLLIGALRLWQVRRGRVELGLWRQPFAPELRRYRLQIINQWLLLALVSTTLVTGAYDIERASFPEWAFNAVFLIGLVALAGLATIPLTGVRLATNLLVLTCSIFLAAQIAWIYKAPVDPVRVDSPLSGEWYVAQGGRAELVNGHQVAVAQDYALDVVQEVNGQSYTGDPKSPASYYAWGEPVRAPADGVIATVISIFPDQPIGSVDLHNPAGNQIVLDIGDGTFIAFGHLQVGSINVSVGQSVRRGEIIGLVGNSGNSDEPHLHVQAQNKAIFDVNKPPPGLITYPLLFDDVQVVRDDQVVPVQPADLRRGDRFSTTG